MRPLSFGPAILSAARRRWDKLTAAATAAVPPVIFRRAERREIFWFMAVILHLPSSLELLVSLGHEFPIHHIKPCRDVFGTAVLVLEIIGMFPDINSEQRLLALADRRVLVRRGFDF